MHVEPTGKQAIFGRVGLRFQMGPRQRSRRSGFVGDLPPPGGKYQILRPGSDHAGDLGKILEPDFLIRPINLSEHSKKRNNRQADSP